MTSDNESPFYMMLPMPVYILSENYSVDTGRSYTIKLEFKNSTILTEIYPGDPRYKLIEDHLKLKGLK